MNLQIAIDGPASSGKSTLAKALAQTLNIIYIDTGAMYRAITYGALQRELDLDDSQQVEKLLNESEITFESTASKDQIVRLNGEDVTNEIRSQAVSENVSRVSSLLAVRQHLVEEQQRIAAKNSIVMDGRDIGTVVLPRANYKFYLNASPEIRAKRRHAENLAKGYSDESYVEILAAIKARDAFDSSREHAPLRKAEDAIEIDTSQQSPDEMLQEILEIMEKA